ncbi:hypothetical protein H5410_053880 [Solanum commersonii]|uniref:Uncharacterized protein n=1 Tax=Solanum commersonii TaxID=4109 RepID=A0A9J5X727_SOLCO|nr:hypothetical protein H5410_053880 [Solanum commersonii]
MKQHLRPAITNSRTLPLPPIYMSTTEILLPHQTHHNYSLSTGTCSHQYSTSITTETELAKQSVPINKIPKSSIDSVIRVLVIRRGSITPYKNSRHEGTCRTIILVDEEIQATLFNKHIETWKDFLKPNKSYYIAKGCLDRVNPNYSSVHNEVELAFTDNTIIKETDHEVSTQKFSNGFLSLDVADNLPNGSILGNYRNVKVVICMLHYDGAHNCNSLGYFAENDGAFLDKLKDDKPILGLCDVRASIYKGRFWISTIPMSSVLINSIFQKEIDLRAWREIIKADNKDITVAPTKAMRKAIEVPLDHILDGSLPDSQKEECHNYRKLVLSKDKQFNFLVRIDLTYANPRRSLIAKEIHQLEDEAPIMLEEEVRSVRKYKKRAKKTTNAAAQINLKKPKAAKN